MFPKDNLLVNATIIMEHVSPNFFNKTSRVIN